MFCHKCGTENYDNALNCSACGEQLQTAAPVTPVNNYTNATINTNPPKVSNYLVPSILVTVFCCLPLGIPAIVFAAQVDGKMRSGDYNGAIDASKKAKLFMWLAFGLGLGVILIYAIFMILVFALANTTSYGY